MRQIFYFFSTTNVENEDFDQHLECAAPKHWSKYTTGEEAGKNKLGSQMRKIYDFLVQPFLGKFWLMEINKQFEAEAKTDLMCLLKFLINFVSFPDHQNSFRISSDDLSTNCQGKASGYDWYITHALEISNA